MADSPDQAVTFHSTDPYGHVPTVSEVSAASAGEAGSLYGGEGDIDPFDFSYYMDRVCAFCVLLETVYLQLTILCGV